MLMLAPKQLMGCFCSDCPSTFICDYNVSGGVWGSVSGVWRCKVCC